MTYSEMHTLIDTLMDKSGQPWFNTTEKDQFLNLALMEFVMQSHRAFELDEKKRQDVAPLVRRVKIDTNSLHRTIALSTLNNFLFLLSMSGVFTTTCGGKQVRVHTASHDDEGLVYAQTGSAHPLYENVGTTHTIPGTTDVYEDAQHVSIQPIQIDDYNTVKDDPFNKPTDSFPLYVVRGDIANHGYIEIYSSDAPKAVYIDYMKNPTDIDTTQYPAASVVLPEYTHEDIVNIAVRKMLENIESPQRYQTQMREIAERDR